MKMHQNKLRKRLLAAVLSAVMCLSALSATASAATKVEAKVGCDQAEHVHGKACYAIVRGEQTCQLAEVE